jgi:hypothetical protein
MVVALFDDPKDLKNGHVIGVWRMNNSLGADQLAVLIVDHLKRNSLRGRSRAAFITRRRRRCGTRNHNKWKACHRG